MADEPERDWDLRGAEGETILGTMHAPRGRSPRATVLLAHGFKGYKDYGFIPVLAAALAARGCRVHRFDFAHSGMTREIATFARPDLFARDTWRRQVDDLEAIVRAIDDGALPGAAAPLVLVGHSRGGVASLLFAAGAAERDVRGPDAVVTIAAPDRCNSLDAAQRAELLERGFLESPSSRTGQVLHVGRDWLREQLEDPEAHDLAQRCRRVRCPVLVIHGDADPTVPVAASAHLAAWLGPRATRVVLAGANHVLDMPNPAGPDDASDAFDATVAAIDGFLS